MATSISWSPTTSISIWPTRRSLNQASAGTRASRSRAVRLACAVERMCCFTTAETERSRTCRSRPESPRPRGTYGLGVSTLDFDDDGWTDIYVANDSNPSTLYRNNHDGTFTDIAVTAGCAYSQDGKPQAGMGVAVGDYDGNGTMDIFKTNFAGDTSTLYANTGKGAVRTGRFSPASDATRAGSGGVSGSSIWISMGGSTLFLVNGHVYPEVEQLKTEMGYRQRKVVYRNLGQRPIRGCERNARSTHHHSEGWPRRGLCRYRQRWRHRHHRQQRERHARSVPNKSPGRTQLADS